MGAPADADSARPAWLTYRPVRERSADQVVAAVTQGLERTGYDEVSLTSLSTTDHSLLRADTLEAEPPS